MSRYENFQFRLRPGGAAPILPLEAVNAPFFTLKKEGKQYTWKGVGPGTSMMGAFAVGGDDSFSRRSHESLDARPLPPRSIGPGQPVWEFHSPVPQVMGLFRSVAQRYDSSPGAGVLWLLRTSQVRPGGSPGSLTTHSSRAVPGLPLSFLTERLRLEIGRGCAGTSSPSVLVLPGQPAFRAWRANLPPAQRNAMDAFHRRLDTGQATMANLPVAARGWLGTGVHSEDAAQTLFQFERSLLEACRLGRMAPELFSKGQAAGRVRTIAQAGGHKSSLESAQEWYDQAAHLATPHPGASKPRKKNRSFIDRVLFGK